MIRLPPPASAVLFVVGVAIFFMSGAVALQMALGPNGLPAAEWLFLLLPTLAFVRLGGFDLRASLFLSRPPLWGLVAGTLLVMGATPVAWGIGWAQSLFLEVPPSVIQAMEELVTARSPGELAWLLVALALTPAVCEEVVFRGVLLSSTSHRGTPWRAVLLNGVFFGAFHLSLETTVRFLPTAWLGIVIAWAVLRTRSLWVGVLMHFLNNGVIVVLASVPAWSGPVTDPDAPPPPALLAAAVVSLWMGTRILALATSHPAEDPQTIESTDSEAS